MAVSPYLPPSSVLDDPQLLLLGGCTLLAFLVERDFVLAGAFADFLRSSNVAFLGTCRNPHPDDEHPKTDKGA
jgi:hypothetical protein